MSVLSISVSAKKKKQKLKDIHCYYKETMDSIKPKSLIKTPEPTTNVSRGNLYLTFEASLLSVVSNDSEKNKDYFKRSK